MSANIKNKNVWVFIETEYGKEKKVGFELLKPGREIADAVKQELVAIVLGKDVKKIRHTFGSSRRWEEKNRHK
jgi:electron transfer flavoprotein alpha subunit